VRVHITAKTFQYPSYADERMDEFLFLRLQLLNLLKFNNKALTFFE
jgi:hypothetical protein